MNQPAPKIKRTGTSIYVQVGIVLLGLIGGYMYYSNVVAPAKVPIRLPDIPANDSLNKFKDIKTFNFDIFSNATFKSLKTFGNIPVQAGETGKTDLFAPF